MPEDQLIKSYVLREKLVLLSTSSIAYAVTASTHMQPPTIFSTIILYILSENYSGHQQKPIAHMTSRSIYKPTP